MRGEYHHRTQEIEERILNIENMIEETNNMSSKIVGQESQGTSKIPNVKIMGIKNGEEIQIKAI